MDTHTHTPRIDGVDIGVGTQLWITWREPWPDGTRLKFVDLDGWIATGSEHIAPLRNREVFCRAKVGEHGAFVTWDDDEGPLSIDASHIELITRWQQPFASDEAAAWQGALGISNSEAAGFLDISLSTWATSNAGSADIPRVVGMLCRSTLRDPLPLHAWLHAARPPGRPRRQALA